MVISEGMALLQRLEARLALGGCDGAGTSQIAGQLTASPSVLGTAVTAKDKDKDKDKEVVKDPCDSIPATEPSDPLDLLFIDADSKDPSLGLSAPPKAFITPCGLRTLYKGTALLHRTACLASIT